MQVNCKFPRRPPVAPSLFCLNYFSAHPVQLFPDSPACGLWLLILTACFFPRLPSCHHTHAPTPAPEGHSSTCAGEEHGVPPKRPTLRRSRAGVNGSALEGASRSPDRRASCLPGRAQAMIKEGLLVASRFSKHPVLSLLFKRRPLPLSLQRPEEKQTSEKEELGRNNSQ